ncbi:hypothetical protein ITP53_10265 [Nonomuraea sp. K274]|uniref:Ketosynthase family 3 (KS3) domain-containing protein n=1 Tax=Nonomuraea cypriaca TaxID=1187855 RepID=A0A931EVY1_9ACTN|nr:beta-ketoacyl synthase N-terminal-like domain-containing protein [Nonomuraea cypriaca]MBF8186124.1 hypothetical protein [Nonomuraea cypriaca]
MDLDPAHRELFGRALATIEELEGRLERAEQDRAVPIAVVGIGCRLPGRIRGADEFWRALRNGTDLVGALDRRTAEPGDYLTGLPGAYLDDVDRFDNEFFGIAPGEATVMDPQQRLLLETAWEAMEHAGMPREAVRGSATGVFLTLATHDYWQVGVSRLGTVPQHDHAVVNNSHSTACARMSYFLGVRGPSLTVDAGCSSALLATHLAGRSLRARECDAALVGAVNLMLTEHSGAGIAESGTLSPDGRCRTFDAGADGYGIGEGCGVVVLKRLADAERDGDRVLAVLRGSAINHNGGGLGYGIPAVAAQREVIRAAYDDAGIPARAATYVESHGTGTSLGDAAELSALAAELLPGRPAERPLVVGAVKTNVSHLFAASGVIGLIKTVLCLHLEEIPGNLHFTRPHPDLGTLPPAIVIPATARPWPRGAEPRVAGVSAFAQGGSNAHLVLAEAPVPTPLADSPPTSLPDSRPDSLATPMVDPLADSRPASLAVPLADPLAESPPARLGVPLVDPLADSRPASLAVPLADPLAESPPARLGVPLVDPLAESRPAPMVDPLVESRPVPLAHSPTDPLDGVGGGGGGVSVPCHGVRPVLVPVSGHDEAALRAVAARLADQLERGEPAVSPADVAYTAARRRSHLTYRGAVVGRTGEELAAALRGLAAGRSGSGAWAGRAAVAGRMAWCLGPGGDWRVMASLAGGDPFRRLVAEAASLVAAETGADLAAAAAGTAIGDGAARGTAVGGGAAAATAVAGGAAAGAAVGGGAVVADQAIVRVLTVLAQIGLGRWWRSVTGEPALVLCAGLGVPAARHLIGGLPLEQTIRSALAASGPDTARQDDGDPRALCRYDDPAALAAAASELARAGRYGVVEIGQVRVPPDAAAVRAPVIAAPAEVAYAAAGAHQAAPNGVQHAGSDGARNAGPPQAVLDGVQHGGPCRVGSDGVQHAGAYRVGSDGVQHAGAYRDGSDGVQHGGPYWDGLDGVRYAGTRQAVLDGVRYAGAGQGGSDGVRYVGAGRAGPEGGQDVGAYESDLDASVLDVLGRLYCRSVDVRWEALYPVGRHADLPAYPWSDRRHWWGRPADAQDGQGAQDGRGAQDGQGAQDGKEPEE